MQSVGKAAEWAARALVGAVLASNLYRAVLFLIQPASFAPAFDLAGISGEAALRGVGVLFVMWNVPYLVAFIHPIRYRTSLWEATAMQAIGVIGESWIWLSLPLEHALLRQSIGRFIVFDLAGLACLLLAAWVSRGARQPAISIRR